MKIKARVQAGLQTESLSLPIPLSFPPLLPGLLLQSYTPSWDSLGFWDWLVDRAQGRREAAEASVWSVLRLVTRGENTTHPSLHRATWQLVGCLHSSSSSRRDVFFLRFPKISVSLSSPLVTPLILGMTASLCFRHICVRVRVHTFWIF